MKKKLLFLSMVLYSYMLFSQDLLITYSVQDDGAIEKFKEKFMNVGADPTTKKIAGVSIEARIEAEKSTYSLEIDEGVSYFYLNELMLSDANGEHQNRLVQAFSQKGDFYQDNKNNQVLEITSNKKTVLEYPLDFYEWELSNETEEIFGYTCYKATTEYKEPHPGRDKDITRKITVWYAPDFPYAFGPQGYGGLPGLILKKCQSGTCFVVSDIQEKEMSIHVPDDKEAISKEAYYKKMKAVKLGF